MTPEEVEKYVERIEKLSGTIISPYAKWDIRKIIEEIYRKGYEDWFERR
mgnify:CR=1 FL=1